MELYKSVNVKHKEGVFYQKSYEKATPGDILRKAKELIDVSDEEIKEVLFKLELYDIRIANCKPLLGDVLKLRSFIDSILEVEE